MEANGFKDRLQKALNNDEFIKLVFQYPASRRAVIKRGKVLKISVESFNFNEIIDGDVEYSYDYIVEIKGDEEYASQSH